MQSAALLIAPDVCEGNSESYKSCHHGPVSQALTAETTDGAGEPVTHIPTCHGAAQKHPVLHSCVPCFWWRAQVQDDVR